MLILYSCEKQKARIPSYLEIEKIDLSVADPYTQGTSSHKIVDAWVYIDDNIQGVYELPATFPVLAEGRHSLKIKAGIKDNGISGSRAEYPFWDFYEVSFDFFPDSVIKINPIVTYYPGTDFTWIEDFEDPGITIDSIYPGHSKINRTSDNTKVFEGNASGIISLDLTKSIFKAQSNTAFKLPKGGSSVYLELNYKATINFKVLLFSNKPTSLIEDHALTVTPTNKSGEAVWNKIYVNLSSLVSNNPDAIDYRIAFYANLSDEEGLSSAEIYLDNIKLVHF